MIQLLRVVLAAISTILLLVGYLASQVAAMQGTYAAYAEKMDAAPIRMLALIVLIAAIGSCFIPESDKEEDGQIGSEQGR